MNGQGIIFEAKYTDHNRIMQNAVTETQSKNFERFQILGGLAYVMVCIQLKDFYRVPWNIWKSMKQLYGHKYMTSSDLEIYKVPCRENFVEILKGIENGRN